MASGYKKEYQMSIESLENMSSLEATELEKLSNSATPIEMPQLNAAVDGYGRNLREFGIQECTEAAKEIFTPDVIDNWPNMTTEHRAEIASAYGEKVAESFELVNYNGVVFETMDGKNGYNNGDGHAYISDSLINEQKSPLQIVDTITHELRHQYQTECIQGLHFVPDDTRIEWIQGAQMYTSEMPWAEDPWGYKYNPLETDARYAGEYVVREMTKDYMTGNYA